MSQGKGRTFNDFVVLCAVADHGPVHADNSVFSICAIGQV